MFYLVNVKLDGVYHHVLMQQCSRFLKLSSSLSDQQCIELVDDFIVWSCLKAEFPYENSLMYWQPMLELEVYNRDNLPEITSGVNMKSFYSGKTSISSFLAAKPDFVECGVTANLS